MKKITYPLLIILLITFSFTLVSCKKGGGVNSYDIECTLDGNTLTGKERFTYYNNTDNSLTEIKFNIYSSAYREGAKYSPISELYKANAYYDGINYGCFKANGVCDKNGELNYQIAGEDENILCVYLREELFPNEKTYMEIEYEITLAKVISRTGITESGINLANFYPVVCAYQNGFYECSYYSFGDPYFTEVANYDVKITLPDNYVVAHSGREQSVKNDNGKNTYRYVLDKGRSFCMVISEKFEVINDTSLGINVNYYYIKDDNARENLDTAVKAVKTFSELFGEYPYTEYSVVQTEFNEGGMEFAGLSYISDGLEKDSYSEVIVHETAHQWWQVGVGTNEVEHAFIDEGLAEYSVVLFYEKHPEYNLSRGDLIKSAENTYRAYVSVYNEIYGNVNTKMDRPLKDFNSEYEYVNTVYVKGAIMHEYIRRTVGDKKYFSAIKNLYKDNKYKVIDTGDFIGAFEKANSNANGIIESFIGGKVII